MNERLVPIDQSNWRAALRVLVSAEQLPMVADSQPVALVILAKAYVQPGGRRWEPLGYVDSDGNIVAVRVLAHTEDVSEVQNLAVDIARQGAGVGTKTMNAVLDWCREQGSSFVEMTVHPDNAAAARLYRGVGFEPAGETRNDEPVWSISLTTAPTREPSAVNQK